MTRHQASLQAIDRATDAFHLEIGTAFQTHNQLVVSVRMYGALNGQIEYAGFDHGPIINRRYFQPRQDFDKAQCPPH